MANPERSQKMQRSRDQWLASKDGRITTRPTRGHDDMVSRVKRGYAVGYQDGQKAARDEQDKD